MPWAVGGTGFYESVIQAIADRYEIPTDVPWQDLTADQQDYFLNGTRGDKVYVQYRNRMGRRRSYMLAFETSMPVSSQTQVWNSKICSSVPWLTSGWYGV